ncbi:hob3 [Apiospora arundinis]
MPGTDWTGRDQDASFDHSNVSISTSCQHQRQRQRQPLAHSRIQQQPGNSSLAAAAATQKIRGDPPSCISTQQPSNLALS